MQSLPAFAPLLLLAPSLVFAALGLMRDAPGEWGQGALIGWTAVAAALLAGAGLVSGAGPIAWAAPVVGFVAVMLGGPPGLAAAGVAAATLMALGSGLPAPRWLPAALAAPPVVVALRAAF
jgi:hypothetical protein